MSASLTCFKSSEIARTGFFMGGPWEVRIHGPHASESGVRAAFREIARLEGLLSRFRPDSEISRINRWDGRTSLRIHPEVFHVIRISLEHAQNSGGAFDPTLGDYRALRIHSKTPVLLSKPKGLKIDLGGIGKGYAIDRAVEILKANDVSHGRVSAGSTAFAWGGAPGRNAWRFAIRDPRNPGRVVDTVEVQNRAISTSGSYEQDGHIRDPRTGCSVIRPGSATVLSPSAAAADALSTAAFVLGSGAGRSLLESIEETEGLFLEPDSCFTTKNTTGWPLKERAGLSRRKFLGGLAAGAALFFLSPALSLAKVYLTPDKALRKVLREAGRFEEGVVSPTPEQKARIEELLGKKINGDEYTVYRGIGESGETVGYGVVVDVIGKERPITFMIGVGTDHRITGLEVMVYRESRGYEIRSKRFRKQFRGISLEDPLKMGQDFYGISGATLSCRSTAFAVRKAMAITRALYGNGGS